MWKKTSAALIAATLMTASASATLFVFKGDGNNVTPVGTAGVDFQEDCASVGDFCSIDSDAGLTFSREGTDLQVRALVASPAELMFPARPFALQSALAEPTSLFTPTRLIQDINPGDSGLGAFSESNGSDDQTQFDSGEAIEFIFDRELSVTNVEFNAGGDRDCTLTADGSGEGICGEFLLEIFDLSNTLISFLVVDITNTNFVDFGVGARFLLTALTPGGGFTVAQLTTSEVPIPGAIPLLITGIAGLRFATRKKSQTA